MMSESFLSIVSLIQNTLLLPSGLHATSVHPGGIGGTELVRHMDPALMQSMMTEHTLPHLKSSEQGSATTVWATVSR